VLVRHQPFGLFCPVRDFAVQTICLLRLPLQLHGNLLDVELVVFSLFSDLFDHIPSHCVAHHIHPNIHSNT
jgi:uncharacterized membrane protein